MNLVLDTCALIDIGHGRSSAAQLLAQAERTIVPAIVVGEFLAGADDSQRGQRIKAWLDAFLNDAAVAPITIETSRLYAAIYRQLRGEGAMIPQNDLWIAATAIEHHAALMTNDRHLLAVKGLRCSTW